MVRHAARRQARRDPGAVGGGAGGGARICAPPTIPTTRASSPSARPGRAAPSPPRSGTKSAAGYTTSSTGARRDATLRPNQLYALGLTTPLVDATRAERVLSVCERELVTPVGLRTRARGDGYHGRITGDQRARDSAYHEGTVWPFLLGIYADACQRVRGRVPSGLLDGLRAHLGGDGLGAARGDLRRRSAASRRAAVRRRRGASPRRYAC